MAFDHGQTKMLVLVAPGRLPSEHLNWARMYGSGRFFFDAAKRDWGYTHVTIPQLRVVPVYQLDDGYIWRFGFHGQNEQKEQMWCRTYFADTRGWLNWEGVCAYQEWYAGCYPSMDHQWEMHFADANPPPPPPLPQQGGDNMTAGLASLIMKMDQKLDQQLGSMREESMHAKGQMEVRFKSMQLAVEQQQMTQLEHFDCVLDGTKEALLQRCETAEKTCTDAIRLNEKACEGAIETHMEATGHLLTDAEVRLQQKQTEKCNEVRQDAAKKQDELAATTQKQFAKNKAQMDEMKIELQAMPYRVIETLLQMAAKRKFALADADVKMLQLAEPCAPQEEDGPDWGENQEPEAEGDPVEADDEEAVGQADLEDAEARGEARQPVEEDAEAHEGEALGKAGGPVDADAREEAMPMPDPRQAAEEKRGKERPVNVDAREEAMPMPDPRQAIEEKLGKEHPVDVEAREGAQAPRRSSGEPSASVSRPMRVAQRIAADDGPRGDGRSPTPQGKAHLRGNSRSRRKAEARSPIRLRSNSRCRRRRR